MSSPSEFADREAAVKADLQRREVERKLTAERRNVRHLTDRLAEVESMLADFTTLNDADMAPTTWAPEPRGKGDPHRATPVLMLSDLHLDERVSLDEMGGINSYDRRIAEMRLEEVVSGTIKLLDRYVGGVELDRLVVALLGDIITGTIHAELARTNEAPVADTIAHFVPILAGMLQHFADELGVPVHVPCVSGNHDRDPSNRRTPSKERERSSSSWIIYSWLAHALRDDPRITFDISVSPHGKLSVYETRFLLVHGDGFRSAGGVGGIYPSMLKYLHRLHQLHSITGVDFDYALMGHWHQLLWGPDFIVNGSLKGYDEYAQGSGFGFEEPQQALFIVTPERGITQRLGVFASDPVAEGWRRKGRRRR